MKKKRSCVCLVRGMITIGIAACVALIGASAESSDNAASVGEIKIHARRYEFSPSEISIQQGATVKLVFISDDVAHAVVIDGLGLEIEIPARRSGTVLVTPADTGDFNGRCSRYCGAGHSAMVFVVHVKS